MAYCRGVPYIYWTTYSGNTKEEQNLQCYLCSASAVLSYEDCLKVILSNEKDALYEKFGNREEVDEYYGTLLSCIRSFIEDVDKEYSTSNSEEE